MCSWAQQFCKGSSLPDVSDDHRVLVRFINGKEKFKNSPTRNGFRCKLFRSNSFSVVKGFAGKFDQSNNFMALPSASSKVRPGWGPDDQWPHNEILNQKRHRRGSLDLCGIAALKIVVPRKSVKRERTSWINRGASLALLGGKISREKENDMNR